MAEPIWKHNLRDAILLAPLVVIHGNVKDVYYIEHSKRGRLPKDRQSDRYVSFDTWLALELEESGFPVVLIYDLIDGGVALRHEMAESYNALAASRTNPDADHSEPDPENSALSPSHPSIALPTSESESSDSCAPDWMVDVEVRQTPEDFFRALYKNVLPQRETPVAIICRFTDRYLSFTDRQDENERRLSLLIQKAALSIPPPTRSRVVNSRIYCCLTWKDRFHRNLTFKRPFPDQCAFRGPRFQNVNNSLWRTTNSFTVNHMIGLIPAIQIKFLMSPTSPKASRCKTCSD